jgi:hypothetical protein
VEPESNESRGLLRTLSAAFSGVFLGFLLSRSNTPTNNPAQGGEPVYPEDNATPERTFGQFQTSIPSEIRPSPAQHYGPDGRKDNTPPWKKNTEIAAVCIAGGLLVVNLFVTIASWRAASASKGAAEWTANQTRLIFNDQRPLIWVKMPEIRIEAGKPIFVANMEIFNYGRTPGLARARIRFEAAQGVIEKFRDTLGTIQKNSRFRITEESARF